MLALGAAFVAWDRRWIFRNFAERVSVDDTAIEATPFYGRTVRMTWDEVSVREENERRAGFHGVFPQIRLVGRDPKSRIVLDGEIPDFDELAEFVRSRTQHASPGRKRRWWELSLPG